MFFYYTVLSMHTEPPESWSANDGTNRKAFIRTTKSIRTATAITKITGKNAARRKRIIHITVTSSVHRGCNHLNLLYLIAICQCYIHMNYIIIEAFKNIAVIILGNASASPCVLITEPAGTYLYQLWSPPEPVI